MTIILTFTAVFLTIYTAQILWMEFLNLWNRTYDEITESCSRVEHFFPGYPSAGRPPFLDQLWNERREDRTSGAGATL